jgi:hypothetical protein
MSLTDLKKNKDVKKVRKDFTIDEFISDAEDYAKGTPKIVSELTKDKPTNKQSLQEAINEAKRYVKMTEVEHQKAKPEPSNGYNKQDKRFRRATFTLSEDAISQLHELSSGTDLAKSHILRILIDELCNKEQNQQLKKLLQSKID